MATYIALINFTEQGITNIKETTNRADKAIEIVTKLGAQLKNMYWTTGGVDAVLILEAPSDETIAAVLLSLARLGNIRTQTLRAFNRAEIESIIKKVV